MDELEHKLIEALKSGKEEAFDEFLNTYGARLHSFASRMCRNEEDAKDVVQETLIGVFKSLKDFRGEGRFRAWFFAIAANACRKMKRKGKFEPEQELSLDDFIPTAHGEGQKPDIADWSQNPDELFRRAELKMQVETAIADLPPLYRVVLILRDMEQLTTQETAQSLNLSPEAVKSRLHRARLFVRDRLAQYWQTGA
jgi:RNA polymerase sigma-70 factor (ECF subfamily)